MGLLTPRNYKQHKINNYVYPSGGGFTPLLSSVGGKQISYVSAGGALRNINVFSVINRIASDVASAHFKTENVAALRRLEQPSLLISRFSFWQGVIIQLCLGGNAYVPLVGHNLENVPLSDVQVNYLPGNVGISYTVAESNERPRMELSQDQMLHFRLMPDPSYRFLIGRSPLESLRDALTVDAKSNESNLKTLENQMSPAGKLKISGLINSDQDLSDARDMFEKANGGANAGRLMTLPDGFDYEQFEMKSDVFKALNENASYSAAQISQAFGVPSDILGGGTSTESAHSNIEQIKATYLSNLNTYVNPIVDELRNKSQSPDLELDIKDMLDVDDSILISQIKDLRSANAIDPVQAQYILKRNGFLPEDMPEFNPNLTMKGGDSSADKG
ncbi:portal protein [Lactiplantibacillus xiangfangensis]|uniref:Portal protein n=1 Tax=Lactiplantibacillus xiangfangensis TaxID=942150 RepID=A0A0R2MKJ2_9LACO|nr:phage portal protein [Lactiplantibacillus xiangfangensis]KRO14233.1 portal protein [Lactiplantibacillus xiangfangensis]